MAYLEYAILTKDNLIKRKWQGDPLCVFCNNPENIEHLFFDCVAAKFAWGVIGVAIGADCRRGGFGQFCW